MLPDEERRRWPEHATMRRTQIAKRRDTIEDFVEWLERNDMVIAKSDGGYGGYERVYAPTHHLVAMYEPTIDAAAYIEEEQDMIAYAVEYFKKRGFATPDDE